MTRRKSNRPALAVRDGERLTFTGIFERFGTKHGWQGRTEDTLLLRDVCLDGEVVTGHLWFNLTKAFATLDLQPGDVVQFDARVTRYVAGCQDRREDVPQTRCVSHKLGRPTKIIRLGRNAE